MLRTLQVFNFARAFARTSLIGGLLVATIAHAANYVYDANGRLRAVVSSTGPASQYVYDALGNLTAIHSVAAGQLAIFAFTPNHGAVGSSVTIVGQGFDTSPNGTTVKFNGTSVVTVTSITTTQAVVVVPAGATTGPVAVTVGTSTVTSAENFTVTSDSGGLSPTITSFTPQIANAGMSIAVTGSHFISNAGATTAGVDVYSSAVTPASDTSLNFTVASQAGPGVVNVTTPYGSAQSAQPLVVVPASVGASNVISSLNLPVDGTAQTINIATAGKYVAGVFQGSSGQWVSLQFSNLPASAQYGYAYVRIYDPSGTPLIAEANSSGGMSIHLPRLPKTGSYLALFRGDVGKMPTFSAAMETNPQVGSATANLVIGAAGQTKRVIFAGAANQLLALNFSSLSVPQNNPVYVRPYDPAVLYGDPNWAGLTNITVFVAEAANFHALPHAGIYTATIFPTNPLTMSAQVSMISNPVGVVVADSPTAFSQSTNISNENGNFSFDAVNGQNLSFAIASFTTLPSVSTIYYGVVDPTGTDVFAGDTACNSPGCHFAIANAKAGTYSVRVVPGRANAPLTISNYSAWVSNDIVGSLTPNSAYTFNLARAGQVARLTFSGSAGQYYSLYLDSVATAHGLTITATKPDDGLALSPGSLNITTATSGILNLPALPTQSGSTYTVQVEANNADTATGHLTLVPDPANSLVVNGAAVPQGTTKPGQASYLSFVGTAGQTLHLGMSAITSTASNLLITLKRASGAVLVSNYSCSVATGCNMPITNIPASGETYTFSVVPNTAATVSYTAALVSP